MNGIPIGRLAREAGVGVETVRFYERKGLLAEPARTPAGYRSYPPETVAQLRFIRRAKDLGFSLREVRELLALKVDAGTTRADVRVRTRAKIADVAARIAGLEAMQASLERLADSCQGTGPVSDCPILAELERDPGPAGTSPDATPSRR